MKNRIQNLLRSRTDLLTDERGLSSVEYVILLVLIAAACVGLWMTLGDIITSRLSDANAEIQKIQVNGDGDDTGEGAETTGG